MKIVQLKASNIKRLRAVEITPDGAMVVISGKNGAGKSSVLDSIEYALAGKGSQCPRPLRKGAKKGEIVCDLGDIVVRRTFGSGGSTQLQVESNGERQLSPQKVLDKLVGSLTFDPLEFSRMSAKEQASTLRSMVGLDTSALDKSYSETYSARATVNRQVKESQAVLDHSPSHPDVPETAVSPESIIEEIGAANESNSRRDAAQLEVSRREDAIEKARSFAQVCVEEAARLQEALAGAQSRVEEARKEVERIESTPVPEVPGVVDLAPLQSKLRELEDLNERIRQQQLWVKRRDELAAAKKSAEMLTRELEDIDERRGEMLREVEFPVDGLGFTESDDVSFGGIPFEQASQAEQLRVSVAMGLAANPKLKVLLIRDGSLLDQDGMNLVSEMAAKHDAQLWVERVEGDQAGAVIIEDGSVVGVEQ